MDGMLELECWLRTRRLVPFDDIIRFAGKTRPVIGSKSWYGNWCWEAYWMKAAVAIQFMVRLHGRKLFDCTAGWDVLYDLWKAEQPINLEIVRNVLREAA